MKNEDIQINAKYIAETILHGEGLETPAEQVQALLSFRADMSALRADKTQHTHAMAIVEATLDFIFEAATPEQVIL